MIKRFNQLYESASTERDQIEDIIKNFEDKYLTDYNFSWRVSSSFIVKGRGEQLGYFTEMPKIYPEYKCTHTVRLSGFKDMSISMLNEFQSLGERFGQLGELEFNFDNHGISYDIMYKQKIPDHERNKKEVVEFAQWLTNYDELDYNWTKEFLQWSLSMEDLDKPARHKLLDIKDDSKKWLDKNKISHKEHGERGLIVNGVIFLYGLADIGVISLDSGTDTNMIRNSVKINWDNLNNRR